MIYVIYLHKDIRGGDKLLNSCSFNLLVYLLQQNNDA